MNTSVKNNEASPSGQRTFPRRFGWLFGIFVVIWVAAMIAVAVYNPSEQAHRAALNYKTHCRYNNYLFYSTMTTIELSGDERQVSTGFLGTVTTLDDGKSH